MLSDVEQPHMGKKNVFLALDKITHSIYLQDIIGNHIVLQLDKKKTHKCYNIVCGILFLTEGSGQPQLSRVFQDLPKRRTHSNTASHTGLSPSHADSSTFCLCGMFV